jgi:hypothetical protein
MNLLFFLKHLGELCIIALIGEENFPYHPRRQKKKNCCLHLRLLKDRIDLTKELNYPR